MVAIFKKLYENNLKIKNKPVPEYVKLELNTIELQYLQASPIS
jgi:hypothetical protein